MPVQSPQDEWQPISNELNSDRSSARLLFNKPGFVMNGGKALKHVVICRIPPDGLLQIAQNRRLYDRRRRLRYFPGNLSQFLTNRRSGAKVNNFNKIWKLAHYVVQELCMRIWPHPQIIFCSQARLGILAKKGLPNESLISAPGSSRRKSAIFCNTV